MLLKPLVLQHVQHNVAKPIDFTICSKIKLMKPIVFTIFKGNKSLKHLTVDALKIDVAKTNDLNKKCLGNVVKPLVLTTLSEVNKWFKRHVRTHVAKTIGFTTYPIIMLLNIVLQQFQKQCC